MYYYYYYWKICSVLWLIAVCVYYIWQVTVNVSLYCSVFHRDTGRMNCRHEEVKMNFWFPLNKLSLQRHYGERERERETVWPGSFSSSFRRVFTTLKLACMSISFCITWTVQCFNTAAGDIWPVLLQTPVTTNQKEPVEPSRAHGLLFFLSSLLHITVKKHETKMYGFIIQWVLIILQCLLLVSLLYLDSLDFL